MKFSVSLRGARPPLPKARPAKRYRGIAEKPHRLASRARTARPTTARPNSMNTWETLGGVVGILEPRAEYQLLSGTIHIAESPRLFSYRRPSGRRTLVG